MEYLQYNKSSCHGAKWVLSFKPYYKWNTFNTVTVLEMLKKKSKVLNLIINGIPSILLKYNYSSFYHCSVLNLIINGIPSILYVDNIEKMYSMWSFKPYYKWNTFNTRTGADDPEASWYSFKPYYKWNTFNTKILF